MAGVHRNTDILIIIMPLGCKPIACISWITWMPVTILILCDELLTFKLIRGTFSPNAKPSPWVIKSSLKHYLLEVICSIQDTMSCPAFTFSSCQIRKNDIKIKLDLSYQKRRGAGQANPEPSKKDKLNLGNSLLLETTGYTQTWCR